jgi:hypothetical protein
MSFVIFAFDNHARDGCFKARGTLSFVQQIEDSLRQLWSLPNDFSKGYVY